MNARLLGLLLMLTAPLVGRTEEPPSPAEAYRTLRTLTPPVVDRSLSDVGNTEMRSLERGACVRVLQLADRRTELTADDLWAVGACHAALGDVDKAAVFFRRSLASRLTADAHLGLARLLLATDLPEADRQYAAAVQLQPNHPDLGKYHLLASQALQARRDWAGAAERLEKYLASLSQQLQRDPKDTVRRALVDQAGLQLDRLRRYDALTGQAAPVVPARHWLQGAAVEPTTLQGKVVLLEFCDLWSPSSRHRMELLQDLHARHGDKGVAVVGLTYLTHQTQDQERNAPRFDAALTPEQERSGIAAFARKHGIGYRLGVVGPEALAEYGVLTLPQTVVLDRQGNVRLILLGTDADGEKVTVADGLLGRIPTTDFKRKGVWSVRSVVEDEKATRRQATVTIEIE